MLLAAALLAGALAAAPADARFRTGTLAAVPGNPADILAGQPVDGQPYDDARGCDRTPRPGTRRLVAWLKRNFRVSSYGVYRCDGGLHSEWRAIDWGLDARIPSQRREGTRLIKLLLAPDRRGTPRALARRMGIQELIWDCSYWSTSASRASRDFTPYSICGGGSGRGNPTAAHLDHIHIGVTVAGSYGRTSFWRGGADAASVPRTLLPPTPGTTGGGLAAP